MWDYLKKCASDQVVRELEITEWKLLEYKMLPILDPSDICYYLFQYFFNAQICKYKSSS